MQVITSHNEMSEGLFGMVILFSFEVLPILEEQNIDVNNIKWDISTVNYGEIFPNILEYNSNYIDPISVHNKVRLFYLRSLIPQYALGDDFVRLNKLFFKYFRIPSKIQQIVDTYDLSDCLGLHFRGTDKTADQNMNTPMTKGDFCIILESYLAKNKTSKIFLATDEAELYCYLKNTYTDIKIISSRDFENNLFWRNPADKQLNATQAMVDMLCLSKCSVVLKVSSALSAFAKIINPDLKIYRLNAVKMFSDIPYFPDAYIPLLTKDSEYKKDCNQTLDEIQKNDWSHKYGKLFCNFYVNPRLN